MQNWCTYESRKYKPVKFRRALIEKEEDKDILMDVKTGIYEGKNASAQFAS